MSCPTSPTEWHSKPDRDSLTCPICNCPIKDVDRHRRDQQGRYWTLIKRADGSVDEKEIGQRKKRDTLLADILRSTEIIIAANDWTSDVGASGSFDVKRPDQTLLVDVAARYFRSNTRISSASTRKHYLVMLKHFAEHLCRLPTLADLNDETVGEFLKWLRDGGRAAVTCNQRRHYVLALWRWCVLRRLVEDSPQVAKLVEPERYPRAWSVEDLKKLFRACCQTAGKVYRVPASDWWLGLYLAIWDTGERKSAVLAFEWDNLEMATGELLVPAEVRKGKRKPAIYALRPQTMEVIRRIAKHRTNPQIFAWHLTEDAFYKHNARLMKRAGLPTHRAGPQMMRRTFASWVERGGENATAALSHSSRKTTEHYYLDPKIVKQRQPNRVLPPIDI